MTTFGLMFAHATNNLLNDLTDSRRGIDRDNYYRNQYGVHVLEDGLLNLRQFLALPWPSPAVLLIALGAWLVWERSGLTFNLMLAGCIFCLVLHLAVKVLRSGRTRRSGGVGAIDGGWHVLRDYRPLELGCGLAEPGICAGGPPLCCSAST